MINLKNLIKEAITGSDRKIMHMIIRDILENFKKAGAKKPSDAVGRGVLSVLRAMTYTPDNANYKNYKKYFSKTFNSKLTQKKLKQFHSQTDKVQLTMVKQAMNKVLGEGKLKEGPRDFIHHSQAKSIQIPKKDVKKAQKLLKKFKWEVEFDTKPVKVPGHIKATTTKKVYNKALEMLVKNGINPRG